MEIIIMKASREYLLFVIKRNKFFSFVVNYLAKDYKNPARNEELKKTLSVAQMILYLEKPVTDPEFFNRIDFTFQVLWI
jgi:hypothetical protein